MLYLEVSDIAYESNHPSSSVNQLTSLFTSHYHNLPVNTLTRSFKSVLVPKKLSSIGQMFFSLAICFQEGISSSLMILGDDDIPRE